MQDRKFFTSMAAALFFMAGITTSCVNDDVLNQDSFDGRTPINFTSSVASRTTNQTIQDEQIATSNGVGLFITNVTSETEQATTSSSLPTNVMLTADGSGNLTSTTPIYFPEGASSIDVYAYAPYNASFDAKLNSDVTFTVASDQSDEAGYIASDFMIAQKNSVPTNNSNVLLAFDHKMVKLNLNFNESLSEQLKGATVTVSGVKTEANVNISTGAVTATETAVDITAAKFDETNPELTASVIFVPQTVESGKLKVKVTKEGQTSYEGVLNQSIEFKGGVRYTYNVELKNSTLVLTPTTSINGWEDTVISPYNVGDYVLADGTIVSSLDNKGDQEVKAIIFSTQVSEIDTKDGYVAYAMGLEIQSGLQWYADPSSTSFDTNKEISGKVSTYAEAINDLNGLSNTTTIYNSLNTNNLLSGSIFESCKSITKIDNNAISDWFVPSMGQIFQILNNLGEGNFTGDTTTDGIQSPDANSTPMYYTNTADIINNINAIVNEAVQNNIIDLNDGGKVFATSSEYLANFWCLQTNTNAGSQSQPSYYEWGFGRNPGKYSQYSKRSFIPCIAIKLPTSASEINSGI